MDGAPPFVVTFTVTTACVAPRLTPAGAGPLVSVSARVVVNTSPVTAPQAACPSWFVA